MDPLLTHDEFFHVRVVIGMIVGLALARLLNGLARFVQHPGGPRPYPTHLLWTAFMLLTVVHFWWFELGLARLVAWSFGIYLLIIGYAALHFFTVVVLYPDRIDDYDGWAGYFHARQGWFFGLLAALLVVDLADSALKGFPHFESLGRFYPLRQMVVAGVCIVAARVRDRRFHFWFAIVAVVLELWRGAREFGLAVG
jgi:hypothetical protein